jgi:hypothetical protein
VVAAVGHQRLARRGAPFGHDDRIRGHRGQRFGVGDCGDGLGTPHSALPTDVFPTFAPRLLVTAFVAFCPALTKVGSLDGTAKVTVGAGVGVAVQLPLSTRYSTASPENGGLKAWDAEPPRTVPAAVLTPVAGFSHSTLNVRVVCDRLTENPPPLGL